MHGISRSSIALGAIALLAIGVFSAPMLAGLTHPAYAADPTTPAANEHVISVSGTGKVTVKPDIADVSLGVQIQRGTAKAARDDAAQTMTTIINALHSLGIEDTNIQTSTLSLSPVYDYNSSTQRVTGYMVTNEITVHVTDLTKLPDILDQSVAAGATNVDGVSFDVSNRTDLENQARAAAVKDARSHADALASAAGVTITGVQSISETSYSNPWPIYGAGVSDSSKGGVPAPTVPTPVQPGTQDITITVSVSYLI
ncbi:MAG TPA: SIMPL domain-containing protein [Candidatus Limnocylindrales bacterium]